MILLGLLPMLLLATFIANKMIRDYSRALSAQYDQASEYVLSSMESVFDNYNTISKMPYFYNMGVGNGADSYFCSIFKVWTTTLTVFMSLLIRRMGRGFLFTTVYTIPSSPMKENSKNWCPMKDWTGKTRI